MELVVKKVKEILLYDGNHTGIIKDKHGNIAYVKNGKFHREDGPAITFAKPNFSFGKEICEWYLDGIYYGKDNEYTAETWTRKVRCMIF